MNSQTYTSTFAGNKMTIMDQKARIIDELTVKRCDENEPFMLVTVKAIIPIKGTSKPFLRQVNQQDNEQPEGILEFDLICDQMGEPVSDTEIEVSMVLDCSKLPAWVKAIRVNGTDNFNIEAI